MANLIKCVQIVGRRERYFPEQIANNEVLLRRAGFMKAEEAVFVLEPEKPFPTPEPIKEPVQTNEATTTKSAEMKTESYKKPSKPKPKK